MGTFIFVLLNDISTIVGHGHKMSNAKYMYVLVNSVEEVKVKWKKMRDT